MGSQISFEFCSDRKTVIEHGWASGDWAMDTNTYSMPMADHTYAAEQQSQPKKCDSSDHQSPARLLISKIESNCCFFFPFNNYRDDECPRPHHPAVFNHVPFGPRLSQRSTPQLPPLDTSSALCCGFGICQC